MINLNWVSLLRRRLSHNPLNPKFSRKGVALLLAMTSLLLMVYIASELAKDSAIEYVVNTQDLKKLKAYFAAKNSLEIALLRVKIFQQASRAPLPESFKSQLDQLWQFPLEWPLPVGALSTDLAKEELGEATAEALFDGAFLQQIMDEGSKFDINDLASPSKSLRDISKKQIVNIFQSKIESDEKFRQEYQNFRFDELVNRIQDWMSDKNTTENGGDKREAFRSLGEGYPPNRGFRTIDELRLVPGMTEEFYQILAPQITIYGMKAINPNTANEKVLKSLDPGITDEAIKEAIERRTDPDKGGPFKGDAKACREDFKAFITSRGSRLNDEDFDKLPFLCDKVTSFRIRAEGRSSTNPGAVKSVITVVVMDTSRAAAQIKSYLKEENKQNQPQPTPGQNPPQTSPTSVPAKQEPLPKGRPRIVYWQEN
jgi:general secretion pathway protein K